MLLSDKNRFKSIIARDRYGTKYVKNFSIMPEPRGWNISVQSWTSTDTRTKTKHLKHIERG